MMGKNVIDYNITLLQAAESILNPAGVRKSIFISPILFYNKFWYQVAITYNFETLFK